MMKKLHLLITLFIFLLAGKTYSKKVEIGLVKQVAVNAFNQKIKSKTGAESKFVELLPNVIDNDTAFYIVNFENSFVIVSAESSTPPVLGYCSGNKFNISIAPPALKYLLNCYKKEIKELKKLDAKPTDEINRKWNELSEGIQLKSGTPVVGPLISTTWGQGNLTNTSYNLYCPSGCPAGCVAVAMAQVLYYWNCRVEGTGQHSYQSNYGTESANFATADYQWSDMHTGSADNDNALLIYHCGVSVNMDYGPFESGSSASMSDVDGTLEDYFGFKTSTDVKWRIEHPFDWKSILKANLNYGWPIIYGGQDDVIEP